MASAINSLIVRVAQKDTVAFEELYQEMRKPVYYYALHFCGNHELAEDVMQDTFISIWSKSGSFISKGSGRAWILTIAKNKSLNALKQNSRICPLEEANELISDESNYFKAFEDQTILGELLRTLNSREADIVMLRHIVGLTLTEIAIEKGMKKGTVFWCYNTAIKKLRAAYERMNGNGEKYL